MRRALVPLALLLPALAGCFSEAPGADVAPAGDAAPPAALPRLPEVVAPTFLPPVELGVVLLGAEPNVAVAPDGTVYVTTPLALWRSDDLGRTYKPIGEPACTPAPACVTSETNPGLDGGGDGATVVGPDGTVHWAGLSGDAGSVPYQRSTDKGESWTKAVDLAGGESSDREWIAMNRAGALFASWRGSQGSEDGVFVTVSTDGGGTWGNVTKVEDDGLQGPVAADPSSDHAYLPRADGDVTVSRTRDGATWETLVVAKGVGRTYVFPVAAVDRAGTVYVVWAQDVFLPGADPTGFLLQGPIAIPRVFYAFSMDHGETWSEPAPVSPEGVPAVFPWIAAGGPGGIAVAWYEGTTPTPSGRLPNLWHAAVAMSTTADAPGATFARSFVGDFNHVGPICTEGLFCSLTAADRSLLDFFEVRLLPDGSPVVAFAGDADVRTATVKVFASVMTEGTKLV
ncbi:MAG TPA: sialidase family protein [Candidatus Thermoplasmatota archaeon]|nr:sialidase family protein [Candidatus Thermoplasmatota archaeon]